MVRLALRAVLALVLVLGVAPSRAQAPGDPPDRVGRLSYVAGTVSYHTEDQTEWSPATLNYPITVGDSLWTEPGSLAEVTVGSTRLRLDETTEMDVAALDDNDLAVRVPQGHVGVTLRRLEAGARARVITPRGEVVVREPGEYAIDAGSEQDPTRVAVIRGLATFDRGGDTFAIRAGETGRISGADPVLMAIERVPIAPPPSAWGARDRVVRFRDPGDDPRDVPLEMTGYEDLDAYGRWVDAPDYGRVWRPASVPPDWAPYRYGHWAWVRPWGWTWIDDEPWGFAPSHYGRWVRLDDGWAWTPGDPGGEIVERPVYAPALVGFIGGLAAGFALASGPTVGWFPLGPREIYAPSYRVSRDYFHRVNGTHVRDVTRITNVYNTVYVTNNTVIAPGAVNQSWRNRQYATVAPQHVFARGESIQRAHLRLPPERLREAAVTPVAAPPASINAAARFPGARGPALNVPVERSAIGGVPTIGRPNLAVPHAPGPRIVARGEPAPRFGGTAPQPGASPSVSPERGAPTLRGAPEPSRAAPGPAQPEPRTVTPSRQPSAFPDRPGAPGPAIMRGDRYTPPPLRSREELQRAMPGPGRMPQPGPQPTPQLSRPMPQPSPQAQPQAQPHATSRDVPRGAYGSLPGQDFQRRFDAGPRPQLPVPQATPQPAPRPQPQIERAPRSQPPPPPPQVRVPTPQPHPQPQPALPPPQMQRAMPQPHAAPAPPPQIQRAPPPQARVAPPPQPRSQPAPQAHPQPQPQAHPQPQPQQQHPQRRGQQPDQPR